MVLLILIGVKEWYINLNFIYFSSNDFKFSFIRGEGGV